MNTMANQRNTLNRTFIIAEAGVNHNGDANLALKLIDVAAESNVDAVKFQTFNALEVISSHAPKAEYQKRFTGATESQLEMVKRLELSESDHEILINHAKKRGIKFLSTPFDSASLRLLTDRFNLDIVKIPSGEITNGPFLLEIAQTERKVILSTGMSTLGEVETALGVLAFGYTSSKKTAPSLKAFEASYLSSKGQQALRRKVSLLHCTTEYPAAYADVNLRAIDTLRLSFGLPVGLSDHTLGTHVAVAAVARGATIIEKHFTLDRSMPGPDHSASLEPSELREMVTAIRNVEEALGDGRKLPCETELQNRIAARKSLVAAENILSGVKFSFNNVACKRPASGLSPMKYWEVLGNRAMHDYMTDELLRS